MPLHHPDGVADLKLVSLGTLKGKHLKLTLTLSLLLASLSQAATIDQWKLTEVKTNGYTYELGPYIGSSVYYNFYLPLFQADLFGPSNPGGSYISWGYTSCPDPCFVAAPRLTNPSIPNAPPSVPEPSTNTLLVMGVGSLAIWAAGKRRAL